MTKTPISALLQFYFKTYSRSVRFFLKKPLYLYFRTGQLLVDTFNW